MRRKSVGELAAGVSLLLHQRLGIHGQGLEAKITRAGRRLPGRIRRRASEIAEAQKREANPRLARMNDPDELYRAFTEVEAYLTKIDPNARRWRAVMGVLASIALGLVVIFGAVTALLIRRGDL